MPTPVKANKLAYYLQGYSQPLTDYIVNGFINGFQLHTKPTTPLQQASKNSNIANNNPQAVNEKIAKELAKGHIAGPFATPPFKEMQISPLSLRPKHDQSGWRLLHDLSFPYDDTSINSTIPEKYKHVTYATIVDAITMIQDTGLGAYMAKTDIASAFTLVPIHPDDYPLLGFQWENRYYYYTTLPQGAASSCFIFETIATALHWILHNKFGVTKLVHYLDDFLFVSRTHQECSLNMLKFHQLCHELGIPINNDKTEGPTTSLTFLGIQLDSTTFTASLPLQKVNKYTSLMTTFLSRKTCTLHQMQQVIGSLQFTTSVVRPGRTFLRRMINSTIGITKPYHHVHLTNNIKEDIQLWITFLNQYNGTTFFIDRTPVSPQEINFYTDSCPQGYGGSFETHYFYGQFPASWSKYNICVLELFPILLALKLFAQQVTNRHIIIHSDNIAVVEVLTHKTTKQPQMLTLLRDLILHCLKFNILFTPRHIRGKLNVLADALSRSCHTFTMLQERNMELHPTPVPPALQPAAYKL